MKGIIALAILILFTLICDYAAVRVSDRKYKDKLLFSIIFHLLYIQNSNIFYIQRNHGKTT